MSKREDELRLTFRLYLNEEKGQSTNQMIEELLATGKYSNRNDLLVEAVRALYEKYHGQSAGVKSYMDEVKRLHILADDLGPVLRKELKAQIEQHDMKMLAMLAQINGAGMNDGNGRDYGACHGETSGEVVVKHGVFVSAEDNGLQQKSSKDKDAVAVDTHVQEDVSEPEEGVLPDTGAEITEGALSYMSQMFGNQD